MSIAAPFIPRLELSTIERGPALKVAWVSAIRPFWHLPFASYDEGRGFLTMCELMTLSPMKSASQDPTCPVCIDVSEHGLGVEAFDRLDASAAVLACVWTGGARRFGLGGRCPVSETREGG